MSMNRMFWFEKWTVSRKVQEKSSAKAPETLRLTNIGKKISKEKERIKDASWLIHSELKMLFEVESASGFWMNYLRQKMLWMI